MRNFTIRAVLTVGAGGLALAGAGAFARQAANPPAVIGSHQIDRFEAIRILQRSTQANPDAVGDWVILGELAHEAALDLPSGQDADYYRMSREAYEKALAQDPNNAGLQAAVQFAQDSEDGAAQFDQGRKRAARTYVDARRREMARTNNAPTVQVYNNPQPQPRRQAQQDDDNVDQRVAQQPQPQPYQTYQPFVPQQAQGQGQARPYTYQQYQKQATYQAPAGGQQAQPMTLRQLGQQLPGALLQDVTGGARNR